MSKVFVQALLRWAKKQEDPAASLEQIVTGQFEKLNAAGGKVLISSTVNGKSFTYTLPSGMSEVKLIELAEVALQYYERGINPVDRTRYRFL